MQLPGFGSKNSALVIGRVDSVTHLASAVDIGALLVDCADAGRLHRRARQ